MALLFFRDVSGAADFPQFPELFKNANVKSLPGGPTILGAKGWAEILVKSRHLVGTHVSFIFRGYFTHIWRA